MAIPANVVVAWPSTAASIPSGWSRLTNLDGKFVQGAPTAGDADLTARGNTTHTHTSAAHTPIQDPHTLGAGSNSFTGQATANGTGSSNGPSHLHSASSSPATTATNQSSTVNFNANTSNDPPYQEVIWIKSDGTPTGIPNGAYAFFDSDSLPSGWSRAQAGSYLKGAAAAGNGGATGGALTHTHDSDSHVHVQDAHTHASFTSGPSTGLSRTPLNGGITVLPPIHTHSLDVGSQTATNQGLVNTSSAVNHEPVYKKLNTILNGVGSADLPNSVIALWNGTHAGVPTGWTRYTGMDGYFCKGASGGDALATGGSQTHTHTATCQPTQNTHIHAVSSSDGGTPYNGVGTDIISGVTVRQTDLHTHTWTDFGTAATNQALVYNTDANTSESAYPPYARLIYIQLSTPTPTVHLGGYTSYDLNRFDIGSPEAQALPEAAARAWSGHPQYQRRG